MLKLFKLRLKKGSLWLYILKLLNEKPYYAYEIKKELIKYMKQNLKLKSDFVNSGDVVRDNIYCVPMYVNKLFKLTKNIMNTRDFGLVKEITQQPVRGRARGGGSRIGQMEINKISFLLIVI